MATLEVNLLNIKKNILLAKSKLEFGEKFCLVAKANAYGLGDKKICKFLESEVDYFAVSSEKEFYKISRVLTKPILILDPIYENITKLAKKNAEFCISNNESFLQVLNEATKHKDINFRIHIAINTGMNRFGFCNENEILEVIDKIKKVQNIFILGVFSHYFEANNKKFANIQYKKFKKLESIISQFLYKEKLIFHICASSALEHKNKFNMVRVGLFSYIDKHYETIKLKAKIIDFQTLKRGESAGYSRQFIAKQETKIAIVSIGYADGVFRNIVNKGYVLINNQYCKIIAICMDSLMVDVTNVGCKIYDDVTLIGRNGDKQIFCCDLARWCDTIEYEILTHISARVERKYIEDKSYADNNRKV